MTWVIGGSTLFGYGFALSDICVSCGEDKELDCLQKIYPVGKFIAAGFSGSVQLGFILLEDLRRFLTLPEKDTAWKPKWVALNWRRRVRRIFNHAPKELRNLGCSILMVGVSPTENLGDAPFPRSIVSVLGAPEFEPQFSKTGGILSIGSGSQVEEYKNKLAEFTKDSYHSLMQMEVGNLGGFANAIKIAITQTLQKKAVKGVSKHLHICIVQRGQVLIGNNDFTTYPKEGPPINFKMPEVAKNWREFDEICKNNNVVSALTAA